MVEEAECPEKNTDLGWATSTLLHGSVGNQIWAAAETSESILKGI